ncbi:MAG: hypothetical protein IJJ26_01130 [Victivallales bacterium]|nr:hypothetical protein [Victivallales bacterium]
MMTHKVFFPLLLTVCFIGTGCAQISDTVRGSMILARGDKAPANQPANPAALTGEQRLDAEIETEKFTTLWRGLDEMVTDYDDVLAGNDKSWFNNRTKKLTRTAVKLVASKAGIDAYDQILDYQKQIADKEQERDKLIAGRFGYPVSSSNPFAMTREKCDKKIQTLGEEIDALNGNIANKTKFLLADLNRFGRIVEEKHLKYLLTAAGGDDVIQMMNLSILLKQVQYAIGKQIKDSSQFNGAQLQHYVGIQLVLLLAYDQAHVIGLENINNKYLPKLAEIQKNARLNMEESRKLQKESADSAEYLAHNLQISENTVKVADQYKVALQQMAQSLQTSKAKVERNVAVTRNTYKTITTGASLLKLIQESSQDYSQIINFNPPILDMIYSDQMMEAFRQVSTELKK